MERETSCPKCGRSNSGVAIQVMTIPPLYHVECWKCGATTIKCLTEAEAIARWRCGWLKRRWKR